MGANDLTLMSDFCINKKGEYTWEESNNHILKTAIYHMLKNMLLSSHYGLPNEKYLESKEVIFKVFSKHEYSTFVGVFHKLLDPVTQPLKGLVSPCRT